MSIRLDDYAIDEEEWMPNPYQEEVNAQMLAQSKQWPQLLIPWPFPLPFGLGQVNENEACVSPAHAQTFQAVQLNQPLGLASPKAAGYQSDDCESLTSEVMSGYVSEAMSGYLGDADHPKRYSGCEFRRVESNTSIASYPEGSTTETESYWAGYSGVSGGSAFFDDLEDPVTNDETEDLNEQHVEGEGDGWGFLLEFSDMVPPDRDGGSSPSSASSPASKSRKPGSHKDREELEGPDGKLSHLRVPRTAKLVEKTPEGPLTTLMIRNIPNRYTRKMLMDELDSLGFVQGYDFIYLPMDKTTHWNVGYAFVNFSCPENATRCMEVMTEYRFRKFRQSSGKVAQVSVAHIQGLEKNLEHYSHTAVQCARIQAHRPLVVSGNKNARGRRQSPKRRLAKTPGQQSDASASDASSFVNSSQHGGRITPKSGEPCPEPSPQVTPNTSFVQAGPNPIDSYS